MAHVSAIRRPFIELKTLFVSAICISGAAASLLLLYRDINRVDDGGEGEPLAQIDRQEQKVRRRTSRSYQWSNAGQAQRLYRKDSVQTGPKSAATIKILKDGSTLELGEDSLVIIDDSKELALNFMRGTAVVRKASGEDSKITVDKDGKTKVEELPARLKTPEPLVQYFVPASGSTNVAFAWEARVKGQAEPEPKDAKAAYKLELSSARSFKPELTRAFSIVGDKSYTSTQELGPGTWYWRVVSPAQKFTEVRSFKITAAAALKPTFPATAHKIKTWSDENTVSFRWVAPEAADQNDVKHQMIVAKDPEFTQILKTESVSASNSTATLKGLGAGTYYWRLKSQYGEVQVQSAALDFAIEKSKKFDVTLSKPDEAASFEKQPKLRFNWSSEAPDAEFTFELADNKGTPVTSFKGRAMAYEWSKLAQGVYQWRVSARFGEQVVGESPWRKFSVFEGRSMALKNPSFNQEMLYWDEPTVFKFSWEKDDLTSEQKDLQYRLELAKDADFKNVAHTKVTREAGVPSTELKLEPGSWFWRVRVVDPAGSVVKSSEPGRFTWNSHPSLAAPAKINVEANAVFDVVANEKDPILSWGEVQGAKAYEVVVTQTAGRDPADQKSGGKKVFLQTVTKSTEIPLKGLTEGKYTWSVRSIDKIDRKGEPSPSRAFSVTYGEQLAAPESTSQEVQ